MHAPFGYQFNNKFPMNTAIESSNKLCLILELCFHITWDFVLRSYYVVSGWVFKVILLGFSMLLTHVTRGLKKAIVSLFSSPSLFDKVPCYNSLSSFLNWWLVKSIWTCFTILDMLHYMDLMFFTCYKICSLQAWVDSLFFWCKYMYLVEFMTI